MRADDDAQDWVALLEGIGAALAAKKQEAKLLEFRLHKIARRA